jgi:hypothetical protein
MIDFLPARDALNLRLSSRHWSRICVRGLFNAIEGVGKNECIVSHTLSIPPHLDDMKRMQEISRRPWMAKRICLLEIYCADLDLCAFRIQVISRLRRRYETA